MTAQHSARPYLVAALILACGVVTDLAHASDPLGPGDIVYVDVHRRPEVSTSGQLDPDGNISIPYIGKVNVAGKTEREAAAVVSSALSRILRNPRVTLSRRGGALTVGTRGENMAIEIIPLQNSDAETISNALQGMTSEGGTIGFDPNSNALLITDTPSVITNVKSAIERLDGMQSQRTQVRIETKIAEVRVGAMKEFGVRWWVQENEIAGGYYPMPSQNVGVNSLLGSESAPIFNETIGGVGNNNTSGADATTGRQFVDDGFGTGGPGRFDRRLNVPVHVPRSGQMFFGLLNDEVDIGALLDALVADEAAELLAAPNILAINHQRSEIKMVDQFPYREFATEITGRTTTGTKFLDLGIQMTVVPHVAQEETGTYVVLDLQPEVSFSSGMADGVPIRRVRSYNGRARVCDGQTLVIGGIYRNDVHDVEQRVPFIGKIPVVGLLFKRTEKSNDQNELMVFVTPTVHQSPETVTWDRMLDITKSSKLVGPELTKAGLMEPETTKE